MRPRICFVVSSELTVRAFLVHQLSVLTDRYDVTVVANTDDPGFLAALGITGRVFPVDLRRRISPWQDFRALVALVRLFRSAGFSAVHSVTPKAGLLAMVAARLARVPVRIHTFTGQVWATALGTRRMILKAADCVIARCATRVLVDSHSQRQFLLREGVVSAGKSSVLAQGSISGVDTARFRPDGRLRQRIRQELGIPADAVACLFVGRLNRDKGVLDLARGFAAARLAVPGLHLVLVGPDESGLRDEVQRAAAMEGAVHFIDFTPTPEHYMAAADVFCLPSHREGFGTVVIEAGAAGLPAIASRIYGLTDAVAEGETGLLHPSGDADGIARCIIRLAEHAAERERMGAQARERAIRNFSQDRLTGALLEFYEDVLDRLPVHEQGGS